MTRYITQEQEKYQKELAKYWPVSSELMAQYTDGSHTEKTDNDTLFWWQNGEQHRGKDKPAVIRSHRDLEWWQNDQLHRDGDQPALIYAAGVLEWYQNNECHRDGDRPAVIRADGRLRWYQNNQLHRSSGPAAINANGDCEWWQNGENITREVRAWLARTRWQGTAEQIAEFQLRFL
jgi:hypothetical protein